MKNVVIVGFILVVISVVSFVLFSNGSSKSSATTTPSTNQCIVTISSKKYDVTNIRKTHKGGDVFECGTDMTAMYQQQHGTSVRIIQQYLVN